MTNGRIVGGLIAVGIGASIAAWFLGEVLRNAGRNVKYYRCPNCRRMIRPYSNPCPWCRTPLEWKSKTTAAESTSNFLGTLGVLIGFFFCLVMSGLCTFFAPTKLMIWTHLSCILGGYLGSSMRYTVAPPR